MKVIVFSLLAALAIGLSGCATTQQEYNENPLVATVPPEVTDARVINAIKKTFVKRRWEIVSSTDNSVTAEIKHRSYDARVTMVHSGRTVTLYAEPRDGQTEVPVGWVENLRKDLGRNLRLEQYDVVID